GGRRCQAAIRPAFAEAKPVRLRRGTSGIEVAVGAEANRPDVLVLCLVEASRLGAVRADLQKSDRVRRSALQPGIQHFQTDLERAGDRPLRTQAAAPDCPIRVAARCRDYAGRAIAQKSFGVV